MKPRVKRWILTLGVACAAVACDGRVLTEPLVNHSSAPTLATAPEVVRLLKRTDRIDHSLRASALIGPKGGHLQIREAGIRIHVPRGALTRTTRITVTALRGRNVAYRFEPHGIVFARPVVIRQSLRNTTAWQDGAFAAQLQGSYFDRLIVDQTESYARSLERRPGSLREGGQMLEFFVEHFSGYMVSTGRIPAEIPLDIDISAR